jgi:hypothetical protein
MTKVFISHAATDKQIADQLAELLTLGLNIKGDEIFCSSLPGRNIEPGFNFVDYIKGALSEAKVVLLLMTENYLASPVLSGRSRRQLDLQGGWEHHSTDCPSNRFFTAQCNAGNHPCA